MPFYQQAGIRNRRGSRVVRDGQIVLRMGRGPQPLPRLSRRQLNLRASNRRRHIVQPIYTIDYNSRDSTTWSAFSSGDMNMENDEHRLRFPEHPRYQQLGLQRFIDNDQFRRVISPPPPDYNLPENIDLGDGSFRGPLPRSPVGNFNSWFSAPSGYTSTIGPHRPHPQNYPYRGAAGGSSR